MLNAKTPRSQGKNAKKDKQIPFVFPSLAFFPWRLGVLAITFLFFCTTNAHPARLASGVAKIDRAGNVRIRLTIDLPAFILNDTPQRISDADMKALVDSSPKDLQAQLDDAQDRLLHSTQLRDGSLESANVPTVKQVEELKQHSGSMPFPMMMDVSLNGSLDPGATGFSI